MRLSSIKFKLMVWNTVIILWIYGIAAGLVYFSMRHRLESLIQKNIDETFDVVKTVVYTSGGDQYDWYHLGQDIPFLIFKEGKSIYFTEAWKKLALPVEYRKADFASKTQQDFDINERHYRMTTGVVRTGLEIKYDFLVVLAFDISDRQSIIEGLGLRLAIGFPLVFVLAILGSLVIVGRALRPVKLVTQKARHISAHSLSERLPVLHPHDEIGQLTMVLNDLLARLESSFERLRQFTADASHEFRTPLTSIRSIGEVALKEDHHNSVYRDAISSILEEAARLNELLNNLLILTRGDSGKMAVSFEPVDLSVLVKSVVDDLSILADEKSIAIKTKMPESEYVELHESSVRQALMNVLHNAIKFTPENGVVEIRMDEMNSDHVFIDVMDSGPGIPLDKRELVFERFVRLDESRHSDSGVGLGLSIAKWAVELNHGTIGFIDAERHGSTCRITFPKKF